MSETRKIIADAIYTVTGITVEDYDAHLLSRRVNIPVEDFLYVVADLEDQRGLPVTKILEAYDYTVFTVNNLAAAIDGYIEAGQTTTGTNV